MQLTSLLLLTGFLGTSIAMAQPPGPGDLVINEIMYDPPDTAANEWIELYNRSEETVDLADLSFQDDNENPVPLTSKPTLIGPGEFAVLVRDSALFEDAFPGVDFLEVDGFPTLNNGGDTPAILAGATVIDAVPYTSSWGGDDASLERLDPNAPSDQDANWGTTTDPGGGTPGSENSIFEPDTVPPEPIVAEAIDETTVVVTFNEPLDQGSAETASNYEILGVGMPAFSTLTESEEVTLDLTGPLEGPQTYTLQISSVEDTQGNAIDQATIDFVFGEGDTPDPLDLVINEIAYDPPSEQPSNNEWVELYNRSDKIFDLADFSFQDDAENPVSVTDTPNLIEPGDYAVLVRNPGAFDTTYTDVEFIAVSGLPALNNAADIPAILFESGVIDGVPYASTWGGDDASLERLDPNGPSDFEGNWGTTTDPAFGTPGEENSIFDPDVSPPEPLEAVASDETTVVITFNEPLDESSAETASNYAIDGIVIASATLMEPEVVALSLSGPLESPETYTLEISGVADLLGNAIDQAEIDFLFIVGDTPEEDDLIINEIAYDPPEGQPTNNEWVELYNRSDKNFDLADFSFQDDAESPVPITEPSILLEPDDYVVLVRNDSAFAADYPGVDYVVVADFPNLNNAGDIPAILFEFEEEVIDAVPYQNSWGGDDASLERRDPEGPSFPPANWGTTDDPSGGTPGARNSIFGPDTEGPLPVEAEADVTGREVTITFNEPLDPASVDASNFEIGEAHPIEDVNYEDGETHVLLILPQPLPDGESDITVRNLRDLTGNETTEATVTITFSPDVTPPQLASVEIVDATTINVEFTEPVTQNASFTIEDGPDVDDAVYDGDPAGAAQLTLGSPLPERELLLFTARQLEDISGNIGDDTVPIFFGDADIAEAGELVFNEVMYDPSTSSTAEYFELINVTDGRIFDLRDLSINEEGTPLKESPAIVPPGGYVAVARNREEVLETFPDAPNVVQADQSFTLPNSGSTLRLASQGVVVDEVTYDPEWHREELDSAKGISLERRAPDQPPDVTNWSSSLAPLGGTPGSPNSLSRQPVEPTEEAGLALGPPFNPDAGEAAAISYRLKSEASLVRARVFTATGRQVREIESGALSSDEGSLTWDGRDEDGKRLRIGPYIVLIEAVDVQGGVTESYRGVVVLARQL